MLIFYLAPVPAMGLSHTIAKLYTSLEFTHEEEKTESEFNIIATKC